MEADLTLAKVTHADLDGTIFTGATVLGANFFGSPVASAYALEDLMGWIQDKSGVPVRESASYPSERREEMMGGLRRLGGA